MTAVAAVAHGTTHLHLTRRGRIVFTTLAAAPLVVGALLIAFAGGTASAVAEGAGAGVNAASFEYVTVQAGQSLWKLAETIAPTADPRDVIAEIVSLNQLSSENVEPGQRLALPAEY